jgi:glycosyl transferase family 25
LKVLLINLDESRERLHWMRREFKRIGVHFDRASAVNGRNLSREKLFAYAKPRVDGVEWAASEIGCFLSHRQCWKTIAEGADPFGAIFEDDLHLDVEVGRLLSSCSWIPVGVELIKLEAPHLPRYQGTAENAEVPHRLFSVDAPWNASGAYIISREAAKSFLAVDSFNCPVDQFLFDNLRAERPCVAHEVRPGVCIQASELLEDAGELGSIIDMDRLPLKPPEDPDGSKIVRPKMKRSLAVKVAIEMLRPFKRTAQRLRRWREVSKAPLIRFPRGSAGA